MRWVGDGRPLDREACKMWIEKNMASFRARGYGMYALEQKDSENFVGCCGIVHPGNQKEPEIKYAFRRSFWGLGYAKEAASALLQHVSSVYGLQRVIATVAPANQASIRVLERAGMRLVEERLDELGEPELLFHWMPDQ